MSKENMFSKANKDRKNKVEDKLTEARRDKFIDENINDADLLLNSKVGTNENFLLKKSDEKIRRTITLDKSVDDFYNKLSEFTGMTRSDIMSNILDIAITDSKEIKELALKEEFVRNLVNEYLDN